MEYVCRVQLTSTLSCLEPAQSEKMLILDDPSKPWKPGTLAFNNICKYIRQIVVSNKLWLRYGVCVRGRGRGERERESKMADVTVSVATSCEVQDHEA